MSTLDDALKKLEKWAQKNRAVRNAETKQEWLDAHAVEVGELLGHKYWLVPSPMLVDRLALLAKQDAAVLGGAPLTDGERALLASATLKRTAGMNGYAFFEGGPLPSAGPDFWGGLLGYVPVHGGITFARRHQEVVAGRSEPTAGIVYGFDTAHIDSDPMLSTNTIWLKQEIEWLIRGIEKATMVEPRYLAADSDDARMSIAQEVYDVRPAAIGRQLGVTGMLSLLSGGKS